MPVQSTSPQGLWAFSMNAAMSARYSRKREGQDSGSRQDFKAEEEVPRVMLDFLVRRGREGADRSTLPALFAIRDGVDAKIDSKLYHVLYGSVVDAFGSCSVAVPSSTALRVLRRLSGRRGESRCSAINEGLWCSFAGNEEMLCCQSCCQYSWAW